VFEGMRAVISGRAISMIGMAGGICLAALYILLACWFYIRMYKHAVRTGLIARYSAETVS
jgi:ABC-2 type transport system permease protein